MMKEPGTNSQGRNLWLREHLG